MRLYLVGVFRIVAGRRVAVSTTIGNKYETRPPVNTAW